MSSLFGIFTLMISRDNISMLMIDSIVFTSVSTDISTDPYSSTKYSLLRRPCNALAKYAKDILNFLYCVTRNNLCPFGIKQNSVYVRLGNKCFKSIFWFIIIFKGNTFSGIIPITFTYFCKSINNSVNIWILFIFFKMNCLESNQIISMIKPRSRRCFTKCVTKQRHVLFWRVWLNCDINNTYGICNLSCHLQKSPCYYGWRILISHYHTLFIASIPLVSLLTSRAARVC